MGHVSTSSISSERFWMMMMMMMMVMVMVMVMMMMMMWLAMVNTGQYWLLMVING